jgi:hypothetical protein
MWAGPVLLVTNKGAILIKAVISAKLMRPASEVVRWRVRPPHASQDEFNELKL